jgi:uncharacterized protein
VADDITIDTRTITTADGVALEAEVAVPVRTVAAVVLCHPHPLQGGTMRSLLPSELFRLLPQRSIAALRFNFRGVEGSGGTHGEGIDEALDVGAAISSLHADLPDASIVVCGWSFGADVSLSVVDPNVAAWAAVAPPLRVIDLDAMAAAHDPRPKLLIVPEHDQFDPPERVRRLTEGWQATTVEVIKGADHFLVGRTDRVASLVVDLVERVTAAQDGRTVTP